MNRKSKIAFSLVEVAIALGVCAFVLISVLGLMSIGLDSGKEAAQDTSVASVIKTIVSDLKTNNYNTLKSGYSSARYFSYGGVETNAAAAHFLCQIEVSAHTSPSLPDHLRNPERAVRARIIIISPVASGKTNRVLETTIASY